MNGGVCNKAQAQCSRVELSKALQNTLLDALADTATGTEFPPSRRAQPAAGEFLTRDATPTKRQLDEMPDSNPPPARRARLTQTDARPPGVEDENADQENADQENKPTLQQPKPQLLKHPYASFLENFVDPVYPHPLAESVYTSVSEWLESLRSDRETRCRSDTHLHLDDSFISRDPTRSAPEMGSTRDTDGFVVPPKPFSTGSRSYAADADTGSIAPSDASSNRSGKSLAEDPLYRPMNLAANNIYMRSSREPFPKHIADLIDHVRRDRDSPGPLPDQVWQDKALEQLGMGAAEPEVEKYFQSRIFPDCDPGDCLKRSDRQPMAKHTVPNAGSQLTVSTPVPDMLYGYSRQAAFPKQQSQLISMGAEMVANNQDLMYPFFVVEFKGDGPSGSGSMWAATNQCLGGSASCVNIVERLNHQLRNCRSKKVQPTDSAAFSIAINGVVAQLYISWKNNELDYYMANVKSFLLQEPEQYIEFRKYVRNIIDWGKDMRLGEIRGSLDTLLEDSRKRTSEAVKSRQPPSSSSATGKGEKHKLSSSRRISSRPDSAQVQRGDTEESFWEWDGTASQDIDESASESFVNLDDPPSQDIDGESDC